MSDVEYDCVVIGSGPGGYVAAIRAAQLGLRTAVVERDTVGGRCLNVACIPAKAVLRTADVVQEIRGADEFGIEVSAPVIDFSAVQQRRAEVVQRLTGGVNGLLAQNAIAYHRGAATLTASGDALLSDGTVLKVTTGVILATGSVGRSLPGLDFGDNVIGTEQAWALESLPGELAVIGAGASGAEIASAYARLGSNVTLYEAFDRVLPSEDVDISKLVERSFKKQGIAVKTGTTYDGQNADRVVIAAGRAPDVEGLGLDVAGVDLLDGGLIQVDDTMRTSHPKVWAIGDLVPGPALAHKASDEGVIAAEALSGRQTHALDAADIPRVTFCSPNVASVGLTEAQARDRGYDVVVGKVGYGAVGAGTVYGDRGGLVKIVGERRYGELLGAHIVGSKATELIQEVVTVRALEGTYSDLARTVHGHPTLAEAVMEAARAADGWLVHG